MSKEKYKDYYYTLVHYYEQLSKYHQIYPNDLDIIKSLFAQLETDRSNIPDELRCLFVDIILNCPEDFITTASLDFKRMDEESLKRQDDVFDKNYRGLFAFDRMEAKAYGYYFEDEEKYNSFIELIARNGGIFNCNLNNTQDFELVDLYKNYITQGRMFSDKKQRLEEMLEKRQKEWSKVKTIHDKNNDISKIVTILKNCSDVNDAYYEYCKLPESLQINKGIYNCMKNKIFNTSNFENSRNFMHKYGELCGKSNDENNINNAIEEVKNLSSIAPYHAYWMFYSLVWNTKIDFEIYLDIYKMFKNEINIQGYLLRQYKEINKEDVKDYEMIKLLEASSDECIKENWYMSVGVELFSTRLYDVLLSRNVSKEELDALEKRYVYYKKTQEEEIRMKAIQDKKEQAKRKVLSLYRKIIH